MSDLKAGGEKKIGMTSVIDEIKSSGRMTFGLFQLQRETFNQLTFSHLPFNYNAELLFSFTDEFLLHVYANFVYCDQGEPKFPSWNLFRVELKKNAIFWQISESFEEYF